MKVSNPVMNSMYFASAKSVNARRKSEVAQNVSDNDLRAKSQISGFNEKLPTTLNRDTVNFGMSGYGSLIFFKGNPSHKASGLGTAKEIKAQPAASESFGYEDVMQKLSDKFGTNDVDTIVKQVTSKKDNLIGEGMSKCVYKLDGIDDYVLAVFKRKDSDGSIKPFKPCDIDLPKFNFGQAVAESEDYALIMGKVAGTAHSMPSWINYTGMHGITPLEITKKEADIVLEKFKAMAEFPLSSYEYVASEFKYLSDNGIRMDVINPNNVMVDNAKKKICLIDVMDQKERFSFLKGHYNGTHDMISLLLDSIMHTKYLDALPEESKESFINASKTIIKKCKTAGENVGLTECRDLAKMHLLNSAKRNGKDFFSEGYDKFVELYKDVL